jgi:hypothetical protein
MKGPKQFLCRFSVATLALVMVWAGNPGTGSTAEQHSADRPTTHNMLVVGEKAVYLSHLPMFQEAGQPSMPHRYQVILAVTFTGQGNDPQRAYADDRQAHSTTKIYTLTPEKFGLPALVSTEPQHAPLRSFHGTIFRGHLEKGGHPILEDVVVHVQQVVHFQEFDPHAQKPAQLEYFFFGKGQELFLAHEITKAPDFDQILSVKVPDHTFTDVELSQGVHVIFPGTTNSAGTRLKMLQQIVGEIPAHNGSVGKKLHVEVGAELYFEEGELKLPPDFNTTPEEKLAGFP